MQLAVRPTVYPYHAAIVQTGQPQTQTCPVACYNRKTAASWTLINVAEINKMFPLILRVYMQTGLYIHIYHHRGMITFFHFFLVVIIWNTAFSICLPFLKDFLRCGSIIIMIISTLTSPSLIVCQGPWGLWTIPKNTSRYFVK